MSIKSFDHVLASLHRINDNLLAISSLGQMIHGLFEDAETMDPEDGERFETMKKFGRGHFNYALVRAIEILADDGLAEWERVAEAYQHKNTERLAQ